MKENLKSREEKAPKFYQHSNYNYNDIRVKMCTLQDKHILPYPDVDPDVLLDCIDNIILTKFEHIHLYK